MNVGRSEITKYKQEDLAKYLPQQILKIAAVHRKWKSKFPLLFIDGSSGDLDPGQITSPQLFLESVFRIRDIKSNLCFIERGFNSSRKKNNSFEKLTENYNKYYSKYKPSNVNVHLMKMELQDHLDKHTEIMPNVLGLLYFDPNGFQLEAYNSIIKFCGRFPRIDLCLNINTNMIQRMRRVPQLGFNKYNDVYLSSILRGLNKKHVWLRDNETISAKNLFKWLMIFASNWKDSSPNQDHFHHIDSPKGQEIINKYNFCTKERINENIRAENQRAIL